MLLVIGLTIVIAFAIVAILVDRPEDGSSASYDPRSDLPFWAFMGKR